MDMGNKTWIGYDIDSAQPRILHSRIRVHKIMTVFMYIHAYIITNAYICNFVCVHVCMTQIMTEPLCVFMCICMT